MAKMNRLLDYTQVAQSSGGSHYDEGDYMPGPGGASGANRFMAERMNGRLPPQMMEYLHGGYPSYAGAQTPGLGMSRAAGSGPSPGGSDMDMMMIYGPEDQVVFDPIGRPIPLSDPRHPRNQFQVQPSYPQTRR